MFLCLWEYMPKSDIAVFVGFLFFFLFGEISILLSFFFFFFPILLSIAVEQDNNPTPVEEGSFLTTSLLTLAIYILLDMFKDESLLLWGLDRQVDFFNFHKRSPASLGPRKVGEVRKSAQRRGTVAGQGRSKIRSRLCMISPCHHYQTLNREQLLSATRLWPKLIKKVSVIRHSREITLDNSQRQGRDWVKSWLQLIGMPRAILVTGVA